MTKKLKNEFPLQSYFITILIDGSIIDFHGRFALFPWIYMSRQEYYRLYTCFSSISHVFEI